MATYFARKSGNINATDVWATTPSGAASDLFPSFTSSDILMSNSFTITINVNATVQEIRTDTTGGATAGGSFTLNNSITLTANVIGGSNNLCLTYSGSSPNSASIVGSVTGGAAAGAAGAVRLSGTGTLNITGNITGGSGGGAAGVEFITNAGTLNVTGNVNGGSAGTAYGIHVSLASSTCNVTGTVTGGSNATAHGILCVVNSAIVTINGTVVGGSAGLGLSNTGSSTITATRAKGNGFGNGSVGLSSVVGISNTSQGATVRVYEIEYGDLGQSPTTGPISIFDASTNVALFYRPSLSKKTLTDPAASGNYPAANNVRSGISYNNGTNIGTLIVPSASQVSFGVAVDNTTGTALLSPSGVWDYLTSNIATSGSIGERLKNCSTIASVGQQLSDIVGPI